MVEVSSLTILKNLDFSYLRDILLKPLKVPSVFQSQGIVFSCESTKQTLTFQALLRGLSLHKLLCEWIEQRASHLEPSTSETEDRKLHVSESPAVSRSINPHS